MCYFPELTGGSGQRAGPHGMHEKIQAHAISAYLNSVYNAQLKQFLQLKSGKKFSFSLSFSCLSCYNFSIASFHIALIFAIHITIF